MFDDRIVFESPGALPGLVRTDNIRSTHFSRNPKIAEFLKAYKYVKEFGEGIDRICSELETRGADIPVFRVDSFILKATLKAEWTNDSEHARPSTAQVMKLVEVMPDSYVSVAEIMSLCGIVRRKTIQESYITPAIADGTIERKYPDQPTNPDQMYILTAEAKKWKKNN